MREKITVKKQRSVPVYNPKAVVSSAVFLHIQNGLLPKEDQELPFAGHIVGTLEHFYFIEDFIACMFMRTQEVIVSDPESKIIVGTVDVIKSVRTAVRSLVRTV